MGGEPSLLWSVCWYIGLKDREMRVSFKVKTAVMVIMRSHRSIVTVVTSEFTAFLCRPQLAKLVVAFPLLGQTTQQTQMSMNE